jgi:hypothetical protein
MRSRGSTRCWGDVLEGAPGAVGALEGAPGAGVVLEGAPGAGGALEGAPCAGGAGRGAGAAGGRVAGHLTEEEKELYKNQIFSTLLLVMIVRVGTRLKRHKMKTFRIIKTGI